MSAIGCVSVSVLKPEHRLADPSDDVPIPARANVDRVIDQVIRPLLVVDGGDIEVRSLNDRELVVRLQGSCCGCAGRFFTTTRVIEPALRHALGSTITITIE